MPAKTKSIVAIVVSLFLAITAAGRDNVDKKTAADQALKGQRQTVSTDLTEVIDPVIFWPTDYGVQQTGMVNTTFDCSGRYGNGWIGGRTSWVPEWPNVSFETPSGTDKEYLYAGALWIGGVVGADTMVSTGSDGWSSNGYEYRSPQHPVGSITTFNSPADFSMRAVYTDTCYYIDQTAQGLVPHVPLGLRGSNRSYVWRNPDDEDIIIFDMVFTNIGDQLLEKVYIGHYMDADVGWAYTPSYHTDDLAGSLREPGIAYIIDNNGDPAGTVYNSTIDVRKIFALKLAASSHEIADTNFNWWVSNGWTTGDFSPRLLPTPEDPYFDYGTGGLGTPEGDTNKYYVLSHREWDYDQVYTGSIGPDDPQWMTPPVEIADDLTNGYDTKFLLSYGPFDISPGANIRLVFAMFTADNVHNFPMAAQLFLPDMPDDFIAALDFDDVLANSARADELTASLLNPMLPVLGLEVACQDLERAILEWDPWVFDNIAGYEVFISEIPTDDIPYPGVVPPWLMEEPSEPAISVGPESRYEFDDPRPGSVYFAKVANRPAGGIGETSDPVLIDYRNLNAPEVTSQTAVYSPGCSSDLSPAASAYPTLRWSPPTGVGVERYNVYRFENPEEFAERYYPFYDEGLYKDVIIPKDTIEIGDRTYYFYAMDVYGEVDGWVHEFTDADPVDGAIYIVTAVNRDGVESHFSESVTSYAVGCFDKDILVLTSLYTGWPAKDSVRIFYEDILAGYNFDIYNFPDTVLKYECSYGPEECVQWQDFTNYKLLILEEDSHHPIFTETFESRSNSIANYLTFGGRLAYFGGFEGFNNYDKSDTAHYTADYDFINRFFGIDSIFYYGFCYYGVLPYGPKLDTSFGFIEAQAESPAWPDVYYDQTRNPYATLINIAWGFETPPSVATFVVNDLGEVSHTYKTLYPETSVLDGHPVGVITKASGAKTYLYGFHLWYMERESARSLIDALFRGLGGGGGSKDGATLPDGLTLSQNYPNPFNPSTIVQFSLPEPAVVTLEIFNILGQRVNTLIDGRQLGAGSHRVEWHSDDGRGNTVSSGVYFYRLKAGDKTATKKMMLLR